MIKTSKKNILKKCILGIIILAGIILCFSIFITKSKSTSAYELNTYSMGTYVNQKVYSQNASDVAVLVSNNIDELDHHISRHIDNSFISEINNNSGASDVLVDSDTLNILNLALDIANSTNGAFDPTIYPLSSLWDFDSNINYVPDDDIINSKLGYVNYADLDIDKNNNTVFLDKQNEGLDLGSIGKGAACDIAVNTYKDNNIDNAIVSVGGSIGILGDKYGDNFNIGIRDPYLALNGDLNSTMGTISTSNSFVSTSGMYQKCFEQDGVLYHHILDPKTGYPVNNGLMSVTISCDNGALSDALATACFVLGKDNSKEILNKYDASAIFIDKDRNVFVTGDFVNNFTITNSEYTLCS